MAIKYLSGIDLNGNSLSNAPVQNLATAPAVATFDEGQMYFNTTDNNLYVLADGAFVDLTSQGDITAVNVKATGNTASQLEIANSGGPIPTFEILTGAVADGQNYLVDSQAVFNAISSSGGGTVTSIVAGTGLTGGTITATGTIAVDYAGTNNFILEAQDLSGTNLEDGFKILYSDTGNDVSFGNVTDLPFTANVGTVTSVTTGNANTITIAGTSTDPTVAANTAAVSDGGANLATGDQIYDFVTAFGYTTNVGTVTEVFGGNGIIISGTPTVGPVVRLDVDGLDNYILTQTAATAEAEDSIAFSVPDTDTPANTTVKRTALKDVPMAALTAVKTYVDAAVAGSTSFQGGYDADTNVPNLDATPTITIEKGMQWVVTDDGSFFTEQVRIGDLLIANNDSPTTLAEWTTVQGNVDLATTTVAGIASFNSDNFAVSAAGAVTIKNNGVILGTETTGNYVKKVTTDTGLDGAVDSEGGTAAIALDFNELPAEVGDMFITLTDGEATPKKSTPAEAAAILNAESSVAATITATGTVTHNLGTKDVIVQLYDIVTFDTVYADVDRTSDNVVTVTFGATPTNSIRVLVQKIG